MNRYVKKPDDTELPKMLMLNGDDEIMKHWQHGTNALVIDRKQISSKISESPWPNHIPVAFRSMTKRKEIWKCWETGRPFYYIDNGYMGNLMKKKKYYRIVKNNIQHTKVNPDMPSDRYLALCQFAPYMNYYGRKPLQGGPILLVTPSEKPCQFYNLDKKTWIEETVAEIKKHTDRPIVIREKGLRPDRIKDNSVASQCARDQIYAVVTYQSMAALEAMHYGIPAFTTALSCVDSVANRNLSDIENPGYPDEAKFLNLLHYLSYCQYTLDEINQGVALSMIEEMKLYD
jgi:hypothetical protein|tara:strand:+ start:45 stop:908 length:864 start_codon:yes stop_codon:yes gene_type:complete